MQITIINPVGMQWFARSQGWTEDEMQRMGRVRGYLRFGRILLWWRWHRKAQERS